MPGDVLRHILSTLPIQLVQHSPDHFPAFKEQWSRERGSTMPPSPLVDMYTLTAEYQPYHLAYDTTVSHPRCVYSANIVWAKHAVALARLVKPYQIWHRSRKIALVCGPLRIYEMQRRLNHVRDNIELIRKGAVTDNESYEISQIITETTLKYMKVDYSEIAKYIRDHKRSSLGSGFKWRDAVAIDHDGWKEIYEGLVYNLEQMLEHPDWYVNNRPNTGARARSEKITPGEINTITRDAHYKANVDRCRPITFGNHMSLYTAFIPHVNKKDWYSESLDRIIDVIKPVGNYTFPYVEGGNTFRIVSDLHEAGRKFTAADGKTWDASAGIVLGKYMSSYMVPIGGVLQIASGQSHTSLNGTAAMVAYTRHQDGDMVCLGDDVNHFGNFKMKEGVIEIEPNDTKFKYTLGISYKEDHLIPRLLGFKGTSDRGDKMEPLKLSAFEPVTKAFGSKLSPQERALHAMMYLGRWSDGTLLERLAKVKAEDFKSPAELIQQVLAVKPKDVLETARNFGITDVVIA